MKKVLVTSLLFSLIITVVAQQDPQFSHDMFNRITLNPAASGYKGHNIINTTIIRRDQWVGIDYGAPMEGSPKSTLASVDTEIDLFGIKNGLSLVIMRDELGYFKDTWIKLGYAYKRKLRNGGLLSFGLDMGILDKKIDASEWIFPETKETLPTNEGKMAFNIGLGAYYQTKNLYAGLSATHLPQNNIDYKTKGAPALKLKRHYFGTVGYNMQLPIQYLEFQPSIYVKTDMITAHYTMNANFLYNKRFWAGVSYRNLEAITLLAGIEMKYGIKFGYAYDINVTKLHYGSHEIFVNYSFYLDFFKAPMKYKSVRFL